MGCKNMGPNVDYRDGHPNGGGVGLPSASQHTSIPYQLPQHPRSYMSMQHPSIRGTGADPWVAAQSLTFLKRGSPASDKKSAMPYAGLGVSPITKSPAGTEIAAMPSLASSSEGTSPGDAVQKVMMSTPESSIDKAGGDNALLMAAVAMTEFGLSPPPLSSMLSPVTHPNYSSQTPTGNSCSSSAYNHGEIGSVSSSKRSINFDEPASEGTGKKKAKTDGVAKYANYYL